MPTFEATVKNLLNMKPKPNDEASTPRKDQAESDEESIMERMTRSKSPIKTNLLCRSVRLQTGRAVQGREGDSLVRYCS